MVGQQPLKLFILVRSQASEHMKKIILPIFGLGMVIIIFAASAAIVMVH
jgi:uncharacterized membrane protein